MKLIFAGISSSASLDYTKFLYNCTRSKCQKAYFIPIRSIKDLFFYADLPAKPDLISVEYFDPCCGLPIPPDIGGSFNEDFNDDFDTGSTSTPLPCDVHPIIFDNYVVGLTPNNSWYGVFQTTAPEPSFKRFYFRFIFTIGGIEYVYYSEEYEIEECSPLVCLKGCYPNEPVGSSAWDCNGIYYGFPTTANILGTANFRYFHSACVRNGKIMDATAKITLSLFKTKRTYKSVLTREKVFEFELVPSFYATQLFGILTRGNIQLGGIEYTLTEEQNWKVLDYDNQFWQLDTLLKQECFNYFGCAPADCVLPLDACINAATQGDFISANGYFTQYFAGIINVGDAIQWELYDTNHLLISNGTILTAPWAFTVHAAIDPATDCFYLKWRISCKAGNYSDWTEKRFGNCGSSGTCHTYLVTALVPITVTYKDCDNVTQTFDLSTAERRQICAIEGTIASTDMANTTIADQGAGCNLNPPCEEYLNDLNHNLNCSWTDCNGIYHNQEDVGPGVSICIQPGTGSGEFGYLRFLGNC